MHQARNGLQPLDAVDDSESQSFGSLLGSGGMTLAGAAGLRATLPTGASTGRANTRAVPKSLSHIYPLSVWAHEAPVCNAIDSLEFLQATQRRISTTSLSETRMGG